MGTTTTTATSMFAVSDGATLITVVRSYAYNFVCKLVRDIVYAAEP